MSSPVRKEVQELQFKILSQLRLFNAGQSINLVNPLSLVATASKYGLIFLGTLTGVTCIQTNTIVSIQAQRDNNREFITSFPRRELKLGVLPSHVAVNCDHELLAVTLIIDSCPLLLIYSVTAFGTLNIKPKCEVRMSSTPGIVVTDLQWNPGVPNIIGAVLSDGSAYVYEFKDNSPTISSIPPNSQASCLCWSPKGKQIVIGAKNGSLTQYKPDLKAVKTFPPPPQIFNQPMVISVHWLSNYQFITAYKDRIDEASKPAVVLVNVPKGAPQNFINYENLCFGFGTIRPEHYFIHQQLWNVILVGSGNAAELAILGQNGESWEQWIQDDSNRAELPVSKQQQQDVYLTGIAVDYSPQNPIPIGENNFVNPMPFVLMYSQEGVLRIFHLINFAPNAPSLCQAPQPLPDQSGIQLFTDIQNEKSGSIKIVEEVQTLENNKSDNGNQQKQGLQFKPPSLGSDNIHLSPKETSLPTPSPFASLNMQKSIPPLMPNVNPGMSTLGGFGMMMANSTVSTALTTPKFSTSSSMTQQPPPNTSAFTFNTYQSQQKTCTQPNTTLINHNAQQPAANKGLFTFQQPFVSISSPFPITSSSEIPTINQDSSKSALLTTPLQTNSSSLVTIPTNSEKIVVNKEGALPKEELSKQTEESVSKESDLMNRSKKEEEKEQSVIEVDFIGAIKEEVSNFNLEVEALQKLKKSLNFSVGHEEINDLVAKINDLKVFEKDVKETTMAQEAEVSALVSSVVELFVWLENVKTKQKQISNPRYIGFMETQDLDPVTKKHINNIEQYIYYLDTQIKQANIQLDTLWNQHQGKPVKSFDMPYMESIYQTIVAENYILAAQKLRVTETEVRLKDKLKSFPRKIPQISDFSSTSIKSNSDTELDKLADKLLLSKLGQNDNLESNSLKGTTEKYILMGNTQKYLSSRKELLLHKWHKNHIVINAKSPKRPTGQIDLKKYSKQVQIISQDSNVPPAAKNTTIAATSTAVQSKSIFTITDQVPFLTQKTVGSAQMVSSKESNEFTTSDLPVNCVKTEELDVQGKHLSILSHKNKLPAKNKVDTAVRETVSSSNQVGSGQVKQSQAATLPIIASDSYEFITQQAMASSTEPGVISNNASDSNRKAVSNANREVATTTPLQPITFDPNFTFKIPSTLSSSNSSIGVTSSNDNISGKLITSAQSTVEVPASSKLLINKDSEIKDINKKEDLRKDPTTDTNKTGTIFAVSSSSYSPTSTTSSNVTEKPVSSTTKISGTNTTVSSGGSIFGVATNVSSAGNVFGPTSVASSTSNIFSASSDSGQNALSSFNFNKSSVFSNVNTNTVVTTGSKTSLFAFTPGNGNTTASTSIFGGKPLISSQFANPSTTVSSSPATTSSTPPASAATSKQATPSAVATTTNFFTKPSAMKSLFSNVQLSSQSSSANVFKAPTSTIASTIFSSSPSQQVHTTTVSSSIVIPVTKVETNSTSISAATTVATTTSVPLVATTTVSNVISGSLANFSFTNSSPEANASNSLITPSSIPAASAAPSIVASTIATSASTPASDKETTSTTSVPATSATTTTTFGITSGSPSVLVGKTTAQNVSAFQTALPTTTATTKDLGESGTIVLGFVPTATESSSIFGNNVSLFGNQVTSPSFGNNTATTTSSIDGRSFSFRTPTTKTTTAPMFGTQATFGTPTTNASVFGAAAALSSTSFFGSPQTTSAFGTPPTNANAPSFFGQAVCSPTATVANAFGTFSFGQKPAAVTTAASIFGNRTFESKPLFGQSGGAIFGQITSSPGTFGSSGGSLFGSASSFGSPQQSNLFQTQTGSTGGSLFNSGSPGGAFTTGNQSVAQSGFGTPSNFQNAAKPFGAAGSTVFGGQTNFGASPTFGGSATFGTPNIVFGTPPAGVPTFGSPTQSSTFENLAGQNTLTFGNLAQAQPSFTTNQPFGMTSPTPPPQNTFLQSSSFGGSSFSTWR